MKTGLILGVSGLVGKALQRELVPTYQVYGTYLSRRPVSFSENALYLNVDEPQRMVSILKAVQPEWIVSCLRGSYPGQMEVHKIAADYLKQNNGRMYYCSTANVFDQDVTRPHHEKDLPMAKSEYGRFKIKCEQMLRKILGDKVTILRLPMLWGKESRRLQELKQKFAKQEAIEVYSNLFINNNSDVMLAKQIHYIVDQQLTGVFHLASEDIVTHEEFVRALLNKLGYSQAKISVRSLSASKYYLALATKYQKLPLKLTLTNQQIIEQLV